MLGLIAQYGSFEEEGGQLISGDASKFEYWSSGKDKGTFGKVTSPVKTGGNRAKLMPDKFLPFHEDKLSEAISKYIKGDAAFKARENPDYEGYSDYDQLMRLEEWAIRLFEAGGGSDA